MDDSSQPGESPAPSPAKGRTSAIKKGARGGLAKKISRKPMPVRKGATRGGRRGRNKTYEDVRAQAAYERQKDLRDVYSDVAGAMKPFLEQLAEASVKEMLEDPEAHQKVQEYHDTCQKLDDHLAARLKEIEREHKTRTDLATREYHLNTKCSEQKFHDGFNAATEDFYDAALNRVAILDEIRREGIPLNTEDNSYKYIQRSDAFAKDQGVFKFFRDDGVFVPFPSLIDRKDKLKDIEASKDVTKPQARKGRPPKRKAEDQLDGQPDSKKSAAAVAGTTRAENEEDVPAPRPRHIKGLLSAENELDGEPESNAPSPTPINEDGQSPDSEPKAESDSGKSYPKGTSEPDPWGVRVVNKNHPKANNRIIIPPPFQWDENEIGFRDSSNDPTKKHTYKYTRGPWLYKPNSLNHHLDRTIVTYDLLDYKDDDLDSELVSKHKLHPKYGLFLPGSVNEWEEPPHDRPDGAKAIVALTPDGSTLHASRTVRAVKMDQALATDARKNKMASLLGKFCEGSGISQDEITTDEMRLRERKARERLVNRDAKERSAQSPADAAHSVRPTAADEAIAQGSVSQLLQAAAQIDAERPLEPPKSRPYDAVRDVFTGAESAAPVPLPQEVDTTGLSYLADVAEHFLQQAQAEIQQVHHRMQLQNDSRVDPQLERRFEQPLELSTMRDSMIDPRLLGSAPDQPPPPPNAFLQTALNLPPTFTHIAPAPHHGSESLPPPAVGRNPFTTQHGNKSSPVLPPLRPTRREIAMEVTPMSQQAPLYPPEFDSPRNMVQTNSGNFFPPAPSRPYHQSYSIHEPLSLGPMPLQQGLFMSGPGMMANQGPPPPPPLQVVPYSAMSPPMQNHSQLANVPTHMAPAPSVSPPGSLMMASSPTSQNGRHRGSISSGSGNGSNKYRKIAAAPIPHNRPWPGSGGAELRLAHYDHKEAIKDYRATEAPPRTGPTTIRGWNINNASKNRNKILRKEDSEEKDSPK
ncbi:hypothetical protein F5Y15DRAFT_389164 [Xylariaceae sp. FL0016]|nr:hypothetical protein F5Y15DRAFT_389164 [Xylariaceae sp. FL0016]